MPRSTRTKPEQQNKAVAAYMEAVKGISEVQLVAVSGRAPDWVRLMTFAALPDDYDAEKAIRHRVYEAELTARDCDPSALVYFDLRSRYADDGRTLADLVPEGYRVLFQRKNIA